MTQKEFAEQLGMTAGNYSRYERGENDIPLSLAKQISVIYDVTIDYIAGEQEATPYRQDEPDYTEIAKNERELAIEEELDRQEREEAEEHAKKEYLKQLIKEVLEEETQKHSPKNDT
jgi:transcriptional regulator with XRE-family HTH domain